MLKLILINQLLGVPQSFPAVQIPEINGYTADTTSIPAVNNVTGDTKNIEKTVVYTPKTYSGQITYVDQNGNTIHQQKFRLVGRLSLGTFLHQLQSLVMESLLKLSQLLIRPSLFNQQIQRLQRTLYQIILERSTQVALPRMI